MFSLQHANLSFVLGIVSKIRFFADMDSVSGNACVPVIVVSMWPGCAELVLYIGQSRRRMYEVNES